ncbi:hypothetical protein Xmau_01487 [Xenorhabdus mauleonii]|uniref:Metal binding domain of Ada n=1 Tax=Xenorhabdus mauleonii TaxID=351675 RepID=A0A1I3PKL8_9GAMM|nr:Ada metal-binding domain-containing protein [Xenorhabdus mauleonii]PHM44773.1 hypothetical protein Xmau_01487 [Xenorhabdus mauleonii]SFJ21881.1 Metal binding domain of Ada [Xenorhabdus mauleonii]
MENKSNSKLIWKLVGLNGKIYLSEIPGTIGGNKLTRIYGMLDCQVAVRAIERGGYVNNRIFFLDEKTAIAAGYRPCAACMPEQYAIWKQKS